MALVGFGTVGRWLARALLENEGVLRERYGVAFKVVSLANERDGFLCSPGGLDLRRALEPGVDGGWSLAGLPSDQRHSTSLDGLRATDADVLVETAASPPSGEPGASHMREALGRGIPVVTSNKWPVARFGVELAALARAHGAAFRAESTVMSGTPLLGALTEGLAGTTPISMRGVVNATANAILTQMAGGATYEDALADAKAAGLAEPDPSADVDGHDAVAKVMILSALVFGRQLEPDDVERRGVSSLEAAEVEAARSNGESIREVASLRFAEPGGVGAAAAQVGPEALPPDDPLAAIDGTMNCLVVQADPLGEVRIAGPGAGPLLAGQGVLSDLIRVGQRSTIREG